MVPLAASHDRVTIPGRLSSGNEQGTQSNEPGTQSNEQGTQSNEPGTQVPG